MHYRPILSPAAWLFGVRRLSNIERCHLRFIFTVVSFRLPLPNCVLVVLPSFIIRATPSAAASRPLSRSRPYESSTVRRCNGSEKTSTSAILKSLVPGKKNRGYCQFLQFTVVKQGTPGTGPGQSDGCNGERTPSQRHRVSESQRPSLPPSKADGSDARGWRRRLPCSVCGLAEREAFSCVHSSRSIGVI